MVRVLLLDMTRAMPKSMTFTEPFFSTMTLWGLMSRWTMPRLWACSRPVAICMAKWRVSFQLRDPFFSIYCFREMPSISSMTMKLALSEEETSYTCTMLG